MFLRSQAAVTLALHRAPYGTSQSNCQLSSCPYSVKLSVCWGCFNWDKRYFKGLGTTCTAGGLHTFIHPSIEVASQ